MQLAVALADQVGGVGHRLTVTLGFQGIMVHSRLCGAAGCRAPLPRPMCTCFL